MSDYGSIEKLRHQHVLDGFDCGKEDLNRFLKRHAWISKQAHGAQTYVLAKDLRVLGYYSLAAGISNFTFEPSPGDPYHLLLIMKDLLQMVAG